MEEAIEEVDRIIRWINHFSSTKCVVFVAGDALSDGLVFAAILQEQFGAHFSGLIKRPKTLEQRLQNCNMVMHELYSLAQKYSWSIPPALADASAARSLAEVFTYFLFLYSR